MAKVLGIGRHWFHAKPYAHYDLPKRFKPEGTNLLVVNQRVILDICKGRII